MSGTFDQLAAVVIANSASGIWEEAVTEWTLTGGDIDNSCSSICVCGHVGLKYLHEITNTKTGNVLFPIGSKCIEKFGVDDLTTEVKLQESFLKLYEHLKERANKKDDVDMKFFSKNMIVNMFNNGAFEPNKYNDEDPKKDYEFLLKMLRQQPKGITEKQQKKINALSQLIVKRFLEKEQGLSASSKGKATRKKDGSTEKEDDDDFDIWPFLLP